MTQSEQTCSSQRGEIIRWWVSVAGVSETHIAQFPQGLFVLQEKDDNVYELVDDDEYSDIVRERQKDNWIVEGG